MSSSVSIWRRLGRLLYWLRLLLLMLLVGLSVLLLQWNREMDPRFFRFLNTPPGRTLARVMNWPNLFDQVLPDKPLEEYSEEEKLWRQKLESAIRATWPTHTLHMTDGSARLVQVLAIDGDHLQIREHYGARGRLETSVQRSLIRGIDPYTAPLPEVTWRDVRFQMEFPAFELTHTGHYTVLTDAPFHQVASSVEALEHLHGQYLDLFSSLIRYPESSGTLQVLFFTREEDYRRHQEATAPDLASSLGYYSPLENRMVLFNHQFSQYTESVREHVKHELGFLSGQTDSAAERKRLYLLQERLEDHIRDQAALETLSTLRHEGAHHLSYTFGVHSWIHAENAWLVEGLAAFFESAEPGQTVPSYQDSLQHLQREGRIPPLARLVGVRIPSDFARELPDVLPHEAYALSWSLFRLCMSPPHRDLFFSYLKSLQDPDDIAKLMNTPRIELLANALSLSPASLEAAWRASL